MDLVAPLLIAISLLFILQVIWERRKMQRVFIADYQCGLHFVNGKFLAELGPGIYNISGRKEQIQLVDMRPEPLILTGIDFKDAWNNDGLITVATDILTADPHLAATTVPDPRNAAIPVMRNSIRTTLSKLIADDSPAFRSKAATAIAEDVAEELGSLGIKAGYIEVIELWSRPIRLQPHAIAN